MDRVDFFRPEVFGTELSSFSTRISFRADRFELGGGGGVFSSASLPSESANKSEEEQIAFWLWDESVLAFSDFWLWDESVLDFSDFWLWDESYSAFSDFWLCEIDIDDIEDDEAVFFFPIFWLCEMEGNVNDDDDDTRGLRLERAEVSEVRGEPREAEKKLI